MAMVMAMATLIVGGGGCDGDCAGYCRPMRCDAMRCDAMRPMRWRLQADTTTMLTVWIAAEMADMVGAVPATTITAIGVDSDSEVERGGNCGYV